MSTTRFLTHNSNVFSRFVIHRRCHSFWGFPTGSPMAFFCFNTSTPLRLGKKNTEPWKDKVDTERIEVSTTAGAEGTKTKKEPFQLRNDIKN